jgi:hypothetical protein
MAIDRLTQEWGAYRQAVAGFYEVVGTALGEGRELEGTEAESADEALGRVATRAERLTDVCIELLEQVSEEDRDRVATRLLAAAATDMAIAEDALRLGPERPEPDPELEAISRDTEIYPTERILGDADALFGRSHGIGGVAGAALDADQAQLLRECEEMFDQLVDSAYDPASRFGLGVIAAGVSHLPALVNTNPFAHLDRIRDAAGLVKRHLVRLLAAGLRKLIGVAGLTSDRLAEQAVGFFGEETLDALRKAARALFTRLLGTAAGRGRAEREARTEIEAVQPLPPPASAAVRGDFHRLRTAYAEQMRWTGIIASGISRASPLISTLAAPAGPLVVAVLDGIGVGFVVYTLHTKLTGRAVTGKVDGVVTVVERRLLAPA